MSFLLQYFIKFSISIAIVFLFYHFVLRKLTFYYWNRFYLLCYVLFSCFIPFINITPFVEEQGMDKNTLVNAIPVLISDIGLLGTDNARSLTLDQWLMIAFGAGVLFMLAKVIFQYISLLRMHRNAVLLAKDNHASLYEVDESVGPFSFGRSIYVNPKLHSQEELQRIIQHEFVHVKQQHTFDLLLAEILCIVNWFNPFAWMVRHAMRQNLEYIADNNVLENGFDRKEYQYLLLKVVGVSTYSIANNFNFSNLKKRIAMMNKMKSAKGHLAKFLFVLPVVCVVLLAFRSQQQEPLLPGLPGDNGEMLTDTLPTPGRTQLPDGVKGIWISNDLITVTLKNGKQEFYHQNNSAEMKEYKKKYGELPPPPPPPPAAPGAPQKVSKNGLNSKGYYISVAHSDDDKIVIVKNKDKKIVTTLAFDEWNSNKTYEEKYGEIPPPPPIVIRVAPTVKGEVQELRIEPTKVIEEVKVAEDVKELKEVKVTGEIKEVRISTQPKVVEGVKIQSTPVISLQPLEAVNVQLKNNSPAVINVGVNPQPLYVIDGVAQPAGTALESIKPDEISHINILKGNSATSLYGEAAKAGAIVITTKEAAGKSGEVVVRGYAKPKSSNDEVVVQGYGKANLKELDAFDGIYIVDGKEYDKKGFKELNLPGEKIGTINVYKGESAIQKFGEKGRKGVIEIKTKDAVITKHPSVLKLKKPSA